MGEQPRVVTARTSSSHGGDGLDGSDLNSNAGRSNIVNLVGACRFDDEPTPEWSFWGALAPAGANGHAGQRCDASAPQS